MPSAPRPCDAHLDLFNFSYPLSHLETASNGSERSGSWPSDRRLPQAKATSCLIRYDLQMLLRGTVSRSHDRRVNRGIGGQEAPSELSRFEPDVFDEAPALVIWQVGTNAVFRNKEFNPDDVAGSIATGLRWLKDLPTDVVLMDLQYTTALVDPKITLGLSEDMVKRYRLRRHS